jgi:choline kinase
MRAVILAAGRGSRMRELTDDRPKCLVELHGKPLLDWQLEALREAGVTEIGIVTGYRRELLSGRGLTEFHNPRWASTNMVASLACAVAWLADEACIVSYGDIFYKPLAVRLLTACAAPLALTYDVNWLALWTSRFGDPLLDAETFRLGRDNALADIGGRPSSVAEVEGQYMGLLRIAPAGWIEISRVLSDMPQPERDVIHMTRVLQKVVEAGRTPVRAIPYAESWGEIDSPEDVQIRRHLNRDPANLRDDPCSETMVAAAEPRLAAEG